MSPQRSNDPMLLAAPRPIGARGLAVLAPMRARLAAGCLTLLAGGPAVAQNPYQYVKFSLQVPWTLYFVFLLLVTVPFALMILLAWGRGRSEEEPQEPRYQESAGAPERPAGK